MSPFTCILFSLPALLAFEAVTLTGFCESGIGGGGGKNSMICFSGDIGFGVVLVAVSGSDGIFSPTLWK